MGTKHHVTSRESIAKDKGLHIQSVANEPHAKPSEGGSKKDLHEHRHDGERADDHDRRKRQEGDPKRWTGPRQFGKKPEQTSVGWNHEEKEDADHPPQ